MPNPWWAVTTGLFLTTLIFAGIAIRSPTTEPSELESLTSKVNLLSETVGGASIRESTLGALATQTEMLLTSPPVTVSEEEIDEINVVADHLASANQVSERLEALQEILSSPDLTVSTPLTLAFLEALQAFPFVDVDSAGEIIDELQGVDQNLTQIDEAIGSFSEEFASLRSTLDDLPNTAQELRALSIALEEARATVDDRNAEVAATVEALAQEFQTGQEAVAESSRLIREISSELDSLGDDPSGASSSPLRVAASIAALGTIFSLYMNWRNTRLQRRRLELELDQARRPPEQERLEPEEASLEPEKEESENQSSQGQEQDPEKPE